MRLRLHVLCWVCPHLAHTGLAEVSQIPRELSVGNVFQTPSVRPLALKFDTIFYTAYFSKKTWI
jgi:hypothetical protein